MGPSVVSPSRLGATHTVIRGPAELDATTDDRLDENRAHWDALADRHPDAEFYDVEGFREGESSLDWLEREGVGDVSGKSLLHLQCHFGMDALSWAREGAARVVGADFSHTAIEHTVTHEWSHSSEIS